MRDKKRVFVSHASEDKEFAQLVVAALEKAGVPCWIAPRDLPLSVSYAEAIIEGVESAFAMVVILSASAYQSGHVYREVEKANREKMPLFPLKIDSVQPSGSLEYFIQSLQHEDFTHGDQKTKIDKLVRQLRKRYRLVTDEGPVDNVKAEVSVSMADDKTVMFTTYHPKEVRRSTRYVLLAFAHLERAMAEVQREANQNFDLMGNNASELSTPSRIQVVKDEIITVIPQMHGIEFQPKQHVLAWNPPIQSCNFLFSVPENAALPLHGRIVFYRGPILAGEIDLKLDPFFPNSRTDPRPVESIARSISPVFASYSHRDSRVMEYFRRRSRQFGQNMLVDIYDIRSGQRWEKRLLEMIDQSAVFQLFWSRHSVTSKYCRMEWEYALERSAQRDRESASRASTEPESTQRTAVDQSPYIRPVWWETRLPPQPKELQHLHFERVSIPPAGLTGILIRTAKWCADCLHKK